MRIEFPLSQLFFAGSRRAAPTAELEALLGRLVGEARAAWPTIHLSNETFLPYLAERAGPGLEAVYASDLYLACACAHQSAPAIDLFARHFLGNLGAALYRFKPTDAFVEDVRQLLMERIFIPGQSGWSKVAEYSGRGPLKSWVRAVALRTALNLRERLRMERPLLEHQIALVPALGKDPELDLIRARYGEEFRKAIASAVGNLTSKERNVLRLFYLSGMSLEQIASAYGAHRVTAARWLASIRQTILKESRRRLSEKLRVANSELDSLLRVMRSELDISLLGSLKASQRL